MWSADVAALALSVDGWWQWQANEDAVMMRSQRLHDE